MGYHAVIRKRLNMNQHDSSNMSSGHAEEGSFLRRWSRRKAKVRDGADGEEAGALITDSSGQEVLDQEEPGRSAAQAPAKPELTDADMPDLASLDQDSDYSPFLSRGVSADLRREALRKLFRQPKFNVETCLEDYQDDYLNFQPLGDIVTCDMRHHAEVEARRKAEKEALESAGQGETVSEFPVESPGHEALLTDSAASEGPNAVASEDLNEDQGTEDRQSDADSETAITANSAHTPQMMPKIVNK